MLSKNTGKEKPKNKKIIILELYDSRFLLFFPPFFSLYASDLSFFAFTGFFCFLLIFFSLAFFNFY